MISVVDLFDYCDITYLCFEAIQNNIFLWVCFEYRRVVFLIVRFKKKKSTIFIKPEGALGCPRGHFWNIVRQHKKILDFDVDFEP